MARIVRQLTVLLNDLPVGSLSLDEQSRTEFRLLNSYKNAYPRPVLGQQFLDDPDRVLAARTRLPPWFSNLLPEGALRDLLVRQLGSSGANEFLLLQSLGDDLPGAVRLVADANDSGLSEAVLMGLAEHPGASPLAADETWHFSLAGVQLKFSALRSDRGLTIPASGRGGDWIVKFPDPRFAEVPRNEFATMQWARASGIEVPEIALHDLIDIEGLPRSLGPWSETQVLAVRRFDRPEPSRRVQIEDFTQVMGLYPDEKYGKANFEMVAKLAYSLTGIDGLRQTVRRLVFMLACGNGDAHLKNWSLIYPDGLVAMVSPSYDLVSTVQYLPDDSLALNLGKSKAWAAMRAESFLRLARQIGVDETVMAGWVDAACEAIWAAWHLGASEFGYDAHARSLMARHARRVPLFDRWRRPA